MKYTCNVQYNFSCKIITKPYKRPIEEKVFENDFPIDELPRDELPLELPRPPPPRRHFINANRSKNNQIRMMRIIEFL